MQPSETLRAEYKRLGYRLLSTEPLFVHDLQKVPRAASPGKVVRVQTRELAERFGKATRSRPLSPEYLGKDAPFRQYVALEGETIVGWVRSVDACDSTWCSNLQVVPSHRRQGIATSLLSKMLRDDRVMGAKQSVLLSSHAGAQLYPRVGYRQLGMLLILAPRKPAVS